MRKQKMTRIVGGLGLVLAAAAPAGAQLANPSPAALGMGDNYSAVARGYAATAWNPANLGLAGNPGWSFNIAAVQGVAGIDPVTLSDLKDYEGQLVPTSVKTQWLESIREEGGEAGTSGFDGSWLALQVGRFGLQFSTSGRALANLSPGVAELLMFGNADAEGNPVAIELGGSTMDMAGYSTGALSYAHPFDLGVSRLAVGVTAKYTMGHFLMIGAESAGATTTDPISVQLRFPLVHTPVEEDEGGFEANSGSGFGVDVGASLDFGMWSFAAAVQNLVSTFEWDESLLRYREGTILFDAENRETDFTSVPYADAQGVPAALSEAVESATFKPVLSAGAAARLLSDLTVSADLRLGGAGGILAAPKTHLGAVVEYRVLPWLPLRAGAAYVQVDEEISGYQLGGGLDLDLGPLNLSGAVLRRSTDLGADTFFMVSLLGFGGL